MTQTAKQAFLPSLCLKGIPCQLSWLIVSFRSTMGVLTTNQCVFYCIFFQIHTLLCLFSILPLQRQIWIISFVIRPGSTGMCYRSCSRFLSPYCEIFIFYFFPWSSTFLILISVSSRSPSGQIGSSPWPTCSWTQRGVKAESVILFSNCDISYK